MCVIVVTPRLNKSFKFQSDWPYNNSQVYLLGPLIDDITSDENRTFSKDDDGYKIVTSVNYPNNSKLVKQEILFDKEINLASCVLNLLKNNPQSYVFAYICGGKAFIGATPEILVEKCGSCIQSYAVAGTFSKCENNEERGKELLNDIKNNHEHKIVIEEIVSTMRTVTNKVSIGTTELMELKNLFHLKTSIVATDGQKNLIEWVRLLHPTPAMGGKPRKKALELIKKYEQHDRGLFATPIGIIERNGDGIFVVGIRSALIEGNKMYAYAGCGIVEQSDCREEYEETNTKLRTILEAL